MMSRVINRIFAIDGFRPYGIRQELVLTALGPVVETLGMSGMVSNHFLQKDDVGIQVAQMVALFVHDQALIKTGKSFVNIVSGDM